MKERPARVFISCGQRDAERGIAHNVSERLRKLGYEPYVAVYGQSLRSLRENIFSHLREKTEYFLFIDFRREKVWKRSWRGSLFSHQELAIASFLEFTDDDMLIFREKGVLDRDGMIGAFQGNAFEFEDRSRLPGMVARKVGRKWQNTWRRELVLEQPNDPDCEAIPQRSGTTGFYFHIKVRNRS